MHYRREYKPKRRGPIEGRTCEWCKGPIDPDKPINVRFCSKKCSTAANTARGGSSRALKKWSLSREYQLTVEQWEAMHEAQGGRCAICGTDDPPQGRLYVDHCHTNGHVRALLCINCNHGLGHFRDDPVLLRAAADYLERHAP